MSTISRDLFSMSVNDKLAFAPLKSAKKYWNLLSGKQAKKALESYNSALSKSTEYSKKLADQGITREALDGLNRKIDKTLNQGIREDMQSFKEGMKGVWDHMTGESNIAPLTESIPTGVKPNVTKMMEHADRMKAMLEEGERLKANADRLGTLKNQIDASTKSTRYLTGLGVAGVAGTGGLSYLKHKKQEEQQPWYKKIGK